MRLLLKDMEKFWKSEAFTQRLWKSFGKVRILLKSCGNVLEK